MFCESCGRRIEGNAEFCPNCGMPLPKGSNGSSDPIASTIKGVTEKIKIPSLGESPVQIPNPVRPAPAPQTPVLDTVLAEGEVIVKKYNCANIRGTNGYLTVTNKRLMFSSVGSSNLNQEVPLSSVSGLTCYRGTNTSWPIVIIGGLLAFIGLFTLFTGSDGAALGIIGLAIGALLVYNGIQTAFMIAVYAKDVQVSPIVVGGGTKSFIGNSALIAVASKPTPETNKMLSELGALVQDLQSMGDLAIEKWKNR